MDDSIERLENEERAISRRRRNLQDRLDFARTTDAKDASSLERLTRLEADEKDVSARRREIQRRLDALLAKAKPRDDA